MWILTTKHTTLIWFYKIKTDFNLNWQNENIVNVGSQGQLVIRGIIEKYFSDLAQLIDTTWQAPAWIGKL